MSIRKQVLYDHKQNKNIGYVNLGDDLNLEEHGTLAREALVFQIVSPRQILNVLLTTFLLRNLAQNRYLN